MKTYEILNEQSTNQRNALEQIKQLYPHSQVVKTKAEAMSVLRNANTNFCVYSIIADNSTAIIGEGTGSRFQVIFPGYATPGHVKAPIAAFIHLLATDIIRVIIPFSSKGEAIQAERKLHKAFNFLHITLKDKISELYQARLKQIESKWNNEQIEKFSLMLELLVLNPTGSEMAHLPRKLPLAEKILPGITQFTKLVFGGYFKNL